MQLHVPTLFFVTVLVMSVIGLLLLWAWLQNREEKTLAWWSAALLLQALGTTFVTLRGLIPDWLSIDLSNTLLFTSFGLLWTGARAFNKRPIHPTFLLGSAIWIAACNFEIFYSSLPARTGMFSVIVATYFILAARDFWRGTEPLPSRCAVVACLILPAVIFFLHLPTINLSQNSGNTPNLEGPWFVFVAFQGIFHNILIAFLLLVLVKERQELGYKTASRIDPLTGTFNRRYFVESAQQVMAKASRDDCPVALIVFDLDHFKKINDSFGHQCGDSILKLFCSTAAAHLRSGDIFGRLGGEEFAAILPVTNAGHARDVANKILIAFEDAGRNLSHAGLKVTASAGFAISGDHASSFDDLFMAADRALYAAKRSGRNCTQEALRLNSPNSQAETALSNKVSGNVSSDARVLHTGSLTQD